ncbi:MAG: hypothetical protein SFV21_10665 [Rhodospirillaceae bacterium]|nr:hypothetical protein [Rhodospirillaceae bacterium]
MGSMRSLGALGVAAALMVASGAAQAAVVAYTNQATFQAALTGSFTLINLDAAPFNGFGTSYRVEDAAPAAAFASAGIDFFNFNAEVRAGQTGQIATPGRDRLIFNGTGFGGEIGVNFAGGVNGIGALSNNIDYGRILIYSGANFTGTLLGQIQFGPGALFGGLTSTDVINSARFTCDFNADRRCGIYDMQFGTFAIAIPEPGALSLLALPMLLLAGAVRRQSAR